MGVSVRWGVCFEASATHPFCANFAFLVFVCAAVLDCTAQGFDEPGIECVMLLRPTQSKVCQGVTASTNTVTANVMSYLG